MACKRDRDTTYALHIKFTDPCEYLSNGWCYRVQIVHVAIRSYKESKISSTKVGQVGS